MAYPSGSPFDLTTFSHSKTYVGVQLGLLASVGCANVPVYRQPRVAVLSTGDEIVDPTQEQLAYGQVRDRSVTAAERWGWLVAFRRSGAV